MIEVYSVMAEREKGALGLLFEMNYFLGFGLTVWILISVFGEGPPLDTHFMPIYNWLLF